MNRLSSTRTRQFELSGVKLLIALALFSVVGCGGENKPGQAAPATNAAVLNPRPPSSPKLAASTNAPPPVKMAERTPEEMFKEGLKLWDGKGVAKNATEAVKLFTQAATKGHANAQAYLAGAYRIGLGTEKDSTEAVRWFRAAAEQGDARSQGVLASLYGTGEGVPKDLAEAVKWYRQAAERGLVRAQANLGAMYFLGQGVAKDPVEAYKWLHLASLKGDREATKNRGLVAQKLSVPQMAEGRKRAADFVPIKSK